MRKLKKVLIELFLALMVVLVYFALKYRTVFSHRAFPGMKNNSAAEYMDKKTKAEPLIDRARETLETCLRFLNAKAFDHEVEEQKQLLLKQRNDVPLPCRESFNTFVFFVDEIINEDVMDIARMGINNLDKALYDAFNDLITSYASYLNDQPGHENFQKAAKMDSN
ncbi:MAG: hypothetical protein LBB20_00300 [Puniceicoccales bacterium]|jgi:hypothetical protein|nr:hypothetical protein [Puniceicoccales bacterium]